MLPISYCILKSFFGAICREICGQHTLTVMVKDRITPIKKDYARVVISIIEVSTYLFSVGYRLCCMRRKLGKNLDQKMWTQCLTRSDEEIFSRMILKQWPGKCTPMSMVILFTILITDQTISFKIFLTPGTINASAKKRTRRLRGNLSILCRMSITTGKLGSVRSIVRLKQKLFLGKVQEISATKNENLRKLNFNQ